MKKIVSILGFIFFSALAVSAETVNFVLSATVPAATSVGVTVNQVNSSTNQFTPVTSTSLSFDPLVYSSVNGIFLPNKYYAIDIAPVGGAGGNMQTSFTYTQGATPNANSRGLGHKMSATFVKTSGSGTNTTDQGLTSHGPKKLLKDLNGETILGSETQGGWLRTYVGIVTMDPNALYPDPAGAEPFSNADAPGKYEGTLTITSTLL